MRVVVLLVVTLVACGKAPAPTTPDDADDDSSAFSDRAGFEPTAFEVVVTGEGGRPIIFIPGLGCPGEVWDGTVERLGDDYEAHVLTLAGFAGRPPIKQLLSAQVRKELTRYIKSKKLEKPIIVGHSMGGLIAYWIAERHPNMVGPVIVVDAGPALSDTDEETGMRLRSVWLKASEEAFSANVRGVFSQMVNDPKHIAPYLDDIARSHPRSMGDSIYELVTTDLRDRVAQIKSPVLIVIADGMFAARIRQQVAPIPNKRVEMIKGAKHFVFLDEPDRFAELVTEFLDE